MSAKNVWLNRDGHCTVHVEEVTLRSSMLSRRVSKPLMLNAHGMHVTVDLNQAGGNPSTLNHLLQLSITPRVVKIAQLAALKVRGVVVKVVWQGWVLEVTAAEAVLDGNTAQTWCLLVASLQTILTTVRLLAVAGNRLTCLWEASLEVLLQANVVTRKPLSIELVSINVDNFRSVVATDELSLFLRNSLCVTENGNVHTTDSTLDKEIKISAPDFSQKFDTLKETDSCVSTVVQDFKMVVIFVPLSRKQQTNGWTGYQFSSDINLSQLTIIYKKECIFLLQNFATKTKLNRSTITLISAADKLHALYDCTVIYQRLSDIFINCLSHKQKYHSKKQSGYDRTVAICSAWMTTVRLDGMIDVKNVCLKFRLSAAAECITYGLKHTSVNFMARNGVLNQNQDTKWEVLVDDFYLYSGSSDQGQILISIPRPSSMQQRLGQLQSQEHFVLKVNCVCIEWSHYIACYVQQCSRCLLDFWNLCLSDGLLYFSVDYDTSLKSFLKNVENIQSANMNRNVTGTVNAYFLLRVDNVVATSCLDKLEVTTKEVLFSYVPQMSGKFNFHADIEGKLTVLRAGCTAVVHERTSSDTSLDLPEGVCGYWSPSMHKSMLAMLENTGFFRDAATAADVEGSGLQKESLSSWLSKFQLHAERKICLCVNISSKHKMELSSDVLLISVRESCLQIWLKETVITFDEMEFVTVEDLNMSKISSDKELCAERQRFQQFVLYWNTAWSITIGLIKVNIPPKHSFPEIFHEELRNLCKWLWQVHKKEEATLSAGSTLPVDLYIKVKNFVWKLVEDPFEERLLENYLLLKDEQEECSKRSKILQAKIMDMRTAGFTLSISQVEHLYDNLSKKNAEIYIRRSQRMRSTKFSKSAVFSCSISNLKLMLLADPSLEGLTNITCIMKEMDDKSPWPSEGLVFSLLWCRTLSARCKDLQLRLRDFPRPLYRATELAVRGCVVGAQLAATRLAERSVVVSISSPWGDELLARNMHPLKLYHNLSIQVKQVELSWGPALAPIMAQCILRFERLLPVSLDTSPPLRYWDKLRLLAHGQLTADCEKVFMMMLSSLDPYDTRDGLCIQATNFTIHLTDGKVKCEGGASADVCTQSRYDEYRLLQLPLLQLGVDLLWGTLLDPHDHHAVIPYAPDKLPHCSQSQEHDSFRVFRSHHLDLRVVLQFKPSGTGAGPAALLYGTALRWLKTWSDALGMVSRPIRQGTVFHNVCPRKISLFRHMRNVQLTLETPTLYLQYWTSFTKQFGFRVIGGPTLLKSEYRVSVIPCLDGLKHRPSLVWCVNYMQCDLNDISVSLNSVDQEPQMWRSKQPAKENSFVRVKMLTYNQESVRFSHGSAGGSRLKHHLVVHGLQGTWNKHNRDTVFVIINSYEQTQQLQRNLSRELIRSIQRTDCTCQKIGNITQSTTTSLPNSLQIPCMPAMLKQLLVKVDTKPVVHCENACEGPQSSEQSLQGLVTCQQHDVIATHCLITFVDSCVMLQGLDMKGFIAMTAAKAELLQQSHAPARRHRSLVSKTTWTVCFEDMLCYATVTDHSHLLHEDLGMRLVQQLKSSMVEDLAGMGSNQSVGGFITINEEAGSVCSSPLQLQRIVSRCKCEIVYVEYGQEVVDPSVLRKDPCVFPDHHGLTEETEETVNCFTFTHYDLDICTNAHQYEMVLDVVNNLVLYMDPRHRQMCDQLQKMRFRLQLLSCKDELRFMLELQDYLRSLYSKLQLLKNEYYNAERLLVVDPCSELIKQEIDDLQLKFGEYEKLVSHQSEELHMMLLCYKEGLLSTQSKLAHTPVSTLRLNEVFLKHVRWQLTDADGLFAVANCILWNFLYVNSIRSDKSGELLAELEYISIENLLPCEPYRKVVYPTRIPASMPVDRKLSLRVICKEKAPVAGISVIEHFEINVAPLTIGLTKKFLYTLLRFFFPQRELCGHRTKKINSNRECKSSHTRFYVDIDSSAEEMKMRAQHNKLFVYTKLTEVPVQLSYRGSTKMENIRDLRLVVPTLQYHNMSWTWFDLLLAIRSDYRHLIFTQTLKQKLKMKKISGSADTSDAEHEEDEVMHLLHGPQACRL